MKLQLPAADFELLPDPCTVVFTNQLVREIGWRCETDAENNTLIISDLLKERYTFEEFSYIEFSIDSIQMPSSSRPTGDYKIDFYDNIEGTYRLVDAVIVQDKIRALPGGLSQVSVTPALGTTYTEDTMTFSFKLGHSLLKNGFLTVQIPEELKFVSSVTCQAFSEGVSQDASCEFDIAKGKMTLQNGFAEGPYQLLETPITIVVAGIFTLRTVRPTSTFELVTFDRNGYAIDTHSTFILPPLRIANEISSMRVLQQNTVVGASTVYDFLIKSPYPQYSGDILTLTVPEQAATTLSQSFKECMGSAE